MVELPCTAPGCNYQGTGAPYKTPEMAASEAVQVLKFHTDTNHPPGGQGGQAREARPQAERVKRPSLTLSGQSIDQEDFDHFKYQYVQYKNRLGDNTDNSTRLLECLAEDVSKMLFSSLGSEMKNLTEAELFDNIITNCVTKQTVQARVTELHRIKQEPGQPVQNFLANLKSKARQCDMKLTCSNVACQTENSYSDPVILGLFINGVHDMELQQDLLAEPNMTLDKAVTLAVARETAKRSQGILDTNQQTAAAISMYKKTLNKITVPPDCCRNCGNKRHNDWRTECPAKDTVCTCGVKGHFRKFCFSDGKKKKPRGGGGAGKAGSGKEADSKEETGHSIGEHCFNLQSGVSPRQGADSSVSLSPGLLQTITQPEEVTLASLQYSPGNDKWVDRAKDENSNKLHVLIKPMLEQWAQLQDDPGCTPAKAKMKKTQAPGIADTGASVLCSGTNLMRQLGLEEKNLIKTETIIRVANGVPLDVLGFVPVSVQVVGLPNKRSIQPLYITRQLKTLFLSRLCLLDLGCLPKSWPYPPEEVETCAPIITETLAPCGCPTRAVTPTAPTQAPFPITDTEECRAKLQEWLLNNYKSSTFNTCPHQVLPGMTGQELKLAIKPGATPTSHTIPHRVPLHWRDKVKEGIDRDIKMGIIEELPPDTPAIWCHKMVVTSKPGSTKPRRTVDMSALKSASYRLTHPGAPPFLEAQSVPANSYKTVTDAWQGFHMIPLHEDSRKYTTFLTEWGMYRYKRMPMGDHVSMDAYNYRFDKVTEGVPNKKRCVDDSLLFTTSLEKAFFQAANYLSLMGTHGIIQCPEKFQFASKTVAWAGFTIGPDSVKPLPKHTEAIRTYPTPTNITDLRSFVALLQQVAYCYAVSPAVAKLRHLLKPSEHWVWDEEINEVFEEAKRVIAEKVEEGVKLFDPNLHTGLLTDWCQEGVGHILCQKHCDCPLAIPEGDCSTPANLNCCKTGWKVCSVGSRFCNSAEANYSPTDGEFTGLVDALEKTAHFTLGCKSLTVGTDHQPLIPIIEGTDMEKVKTPRQIRLKEKLMRWDLRVAYVPGKNLGGTDALSRYGVRVNNDETVNWISMMVTNMADKDSVAPWSEDSLCAMTGSQPPVTQREILAATTTDKSLTRLKSHILQGFPETRAELPTDLQPYWVVRDMLTEYEGVIYMGDRVVVPEELRARTLDTLHAAHQGTTSMRLRAERNLFWPNMARDIAGRRMACISCDETAPSQSPEPPITPVTPEYPFQHICSDYFSLKGHNFCLVVDRFSNWLQIFTGKGGSHNLISLLGQCFHSFGLPETLTSDGGPEYTAGATKEFLGKLGIHHRLTSVGFPHANQKAERSVGTAKRIIRDAVKPNGELDTITLIKGLLAMRNTPDRDIGMSPAQMLLGRDLRDFLPGTKPKPHMISHTDMREKWQQVAEWRELALAPRTAKLNEKLKQGSKELPPLKIGDHVMMQNQLGNKPKRWDKRGVVVQADPKTRQYKVMTFGSRRMTLRNRKFLRHYTPINPPPSTPTGLQLGQRLGRQSPVQSPVQSPDPIVIAPPAPLQATTPTPAPPVPVHTQTRPGPQYTLPPPPEPVHQTEISQPRVCTQYSLPPAPSQSAPQAAPTFQMTPTQPVPDTPTLNQEPVVVPMSTRVSARSNKGMTRRYDDFVQQISLKPGTYASDGTNLFKLEDIGNRTMEHLHRQQNTWQQNIQPQNTWQQNILPQNTWQQNFLPQNTWQQNIPPQNTWQQNYWSPDTANVAHLACDMHNQAHWGNMFNNGGYLSNDVYSCYGDFRP